MGIEKTSREARDAMRKKSALMLPNNPSAAGMKPDAIRKTLVAPVLDSDDSILSELDRIVDEINESFDELEAEREETKEGFNSRMLEHEENVDNPHDVTAEQVGLGLVDNTSDEDKPVSKAQQKALDKKLDKVTLPGKNLAYGVSTEGEQRTFPMTAESWTYSIAMRNNQRTFDIGEPKAGTHPVNRAYLERILEAFVAKQGDQTIGGNLSISGDLYVTGSTYGTDVESLNVKDAVIVANADGVPLAELSGYVIRVSDTQAYGILYDPVEDCVKIGLGTFDGKVFVYGANEAQVLATRNVIEHGNVPVWNGEKNTFEDSGKQADKLATEQYIDELYGDIEGALSAILAEQKSILAMQDTLIGGGV